MNMELSRRHFIVGASAGLAGTTLGAFGFGDIEAAHAQAIKPFRTHADQGSAHHLPLLCSELRHDGLRRA